jgi:polyphosphate kinase
MGSPDLMHRNLDRRVETLVRVKDPSVRGQLVQLLDHAFAPDVRRWELGSDGCWQRAPEPGAPSRDLQADQLRRSSERPGS